MAQKNLKENFKFCYFQAPYVQTKGFQYLQYYFQVTLISQPIPLTLQHMQRSEGAECSSVRLHNGNSITKCDRLCFSQWEIPAVNNQYRTKRIYINGVLRTLQMVTVLFRIIRSIQLHTTFGLNFRGN
jgi:hypothetical protein